MQFIHKATVWTKSGIDIFGRPGWSAPVVVNCRWEDITTTYRDNFGNQARAKSRVYVDRPLEVGDMIVRGTSVDVTPYAPDINAKEIKDFRMISNVAGDRTEYRVLL